MFTLPAQRMLRALSVWLWRGSEWAGGLAAQLEARPANKLDFKLQPMRLRLPLAARQRIGLRVRSTSRQLTGWRSYVTPSAGQRVEIHAQAQLGEVPAAPEQPTGGVTRPVGAEDGEPARSMPGQPSSGQSAARPTPAPAAEISALPSRRSSPGAAPGREVRLSNPWLCP